MLMLIILMFLHFFVDYFASFSLLSLGLHYQGLAWLFLVYNILAFLPQPLFGFLIDKTAPKHFVSIGLAMLAIGFLFVDVSPWAGVVFLGLGNAIFHVAGGKIIINSNEKKWPLGAFVGMGAIGLACAWAFPDNTDLATVFFLLTVVALTAFQFVKMTVIERSDEAAPIKVPWLLLVAVAILVRAFLGKYVTYEISFALWVLLAGCAAGVGKIVGGFLADRFGVTVTVIISTVLGLASLFFTHNAVLSIVGILAINIAMPITLYLIIRAMPHYTATAFGIAAMTLIPGFYAGLFFASYYSIFVTIGLMLLNIAIIVLANHRLKMASDVDLWK
ncbi:MAG: hypothetical protein NTV44_03330 [Firmicutes bacterium]|nr:hypothetical protein [Bacillota bacterium]